MGRCSKSQRRPAAGVLLGQLADQAAFLSLRERLRLLDLLRYELRHLHTVDLHVDQGVVLAAICLRRCDVEPQLAEFSRATLCMGVVPGRKAEPGAVDRLAEVPKENHEEE